MKKKGLPCLLALLTAICLLATGCGETAGTPAQPSAAPEQTAEQQAAPQTVEQSAEPAEAGASQLEVPIAELPILVTSSGQSADYEMARVMFDKLGIDYESDGTITAENLSADVKTLVVAIGGSSKGLGAAGIDAGAELERVDALLAAAKENGATIIALHIGGSGRRGKLGDRYIEPVISQADYAIVVESGNGDGLFTQLAETYGIPMDLIPNMTDAIPLLDAAVIH